MVAPPQGTQIEGTPFLGVPCNRRLCRLPPDWRQICIEGEVQRLKKEVVQT